VAARLVGLSARPAIPLARPCFGEAEERQLLETLRSGWVSQGPRVQAFEQAFAARVGAACAVAVSSCTAGLFLVLHELGVGPGDEVIVPSLTFVASANAIVHAGAEPVFVDVEPSTLNLDPEAISAATSSRTRAVMVVHQLGIPADLARIADVARERGLSLIEDAACAVGSRLYGRPIGGSGHPCCFSFHPRKVLVTGEGGMITTDDPGLAERLKRARHQGMSVSDLERSRSDRVIIESYPEIGYNFRMSDLQAAVGLAQLGRVSGFVTERRMLAARYDQALALLPGVAPLVVPDGAEPNRQSYIARLVGADVSRRNALLQALARRGVESRRGLMACHREAPHRNARRAGGLPHTEAAADQTFLLPLFNGMREEQQARVVAALQDAMAELGPG
jgi:dTDP-4-amino-4,6-dideoxygalactose transaminase